MKRTFEIEWPDDCGDFWMNKDSLMSCLTTETHVGGKAWVKAEDVTDDVSRLSVIKEAVAPVRAFAEKQREEHSPRDMGARFRKFLSECSDIEVEAIRATFLLADDAGIDCGAFKHLTDDERVWEAVGVCHGIAKGAADTRKTWQAVNG